MVTMLKDGRIEGIKVVPCRLQGPRGIVKTFLLYDDHSLVIVDTGFSASDGELIKEQIQQVGRSVADVSLCVITHHHLDHVGGLKALLSLGTFPVASHEAEAERITATCGVGVDRYVSDSEMIALAGGIQVVHMPGHTPGSIALYVPRARALIAGDAIFSAGEWLIVSPSYLCEDPDQARASVQRLLGLGLPIDTLLVAHGDDVYGTAAEPLAKIFMSRRSEWG